MKGVPLFAASSQRQTLLPGLLFFSLDLELKVAISALSPAFISPFLFYHMVNLKDDKPGPCAPPQGLFSSLVP